MSFSKIACTLAGVSLLPPAGCFKDGCVSILVGFTPVSFIGALTLVADA